MDGGVEMTLEEIKADIERYKPLITGVTFSGGDPVYQLDDTLKLARWAKSKGLQTTLYTGYKYPDIYDEVAEFPKFEDSPFDYIIDGKYIESYKSTKRAFRGSGNQKMYRRVGGWGYVEIK